jgi:hypothetical protein
MKSSMQSQYMQNLSLQSLYAMPVIPDLNIESASLLVTSISVVTTSTRIKIDCSTSLVRSSVRLKVTYSRMGHSPRVSGLNLNCPSAMDSEKGDSE